MYDSFHEPLLRSDITEVSVLDEVATCLVLGPVLTRLVYQHRFSATHSFVLLLEIVSVLYFLSWCVMNK